jgi:hypothetical protein
VTFPDEIEDCKWYPQGRQNKNKKKKNQGMLFLRLFNEKKRWVVL